MKTIILAAMVAAIACMSCGCRTAEIVLTEPSSGTRVCLRVETQTTNSLGMSSGKGEFYGR